MPFALYTLKHATISENKVNKSSVGGEVHETSKRSKGNGLNEKVTSYRTSSYFFHGFLKERQGKARKPGDHRLKEVLVLVYLFNTRDGNVFIKTSLASFLK